MNHRNASIKVGLLTTVSLSALIVMLIWLRGCSFGTNQTYDVAFKDVDGLKEGAPVQFMGVRVGFVDEVNPILQKGRRYRVHVKFSIRDQQVHIPKGSLLSLEQSGIIGEKFLEITPPRPMAAEFIFPHEESHLYKGMPVMLQYRDGVYQVGQVLDFHLKTIPKVTRNTPDYDYRVIYTLNKGGYHPPDKPNIKLDFQNGQSFLLLSDEELRWQHSPKEDPYFSMEEPLRLKDFLQEQLVSAESLKETNDKINLLLSDETIATIQGTLKNSERLTAEAAKVLEEAHSLFSSTSDDLKSLVASTQRLTISVTEVSRNINDIAGNPKVKRDIQETIQSLHDSSSQLESLLNDPQLHVILSNVKVTSDNAAELMKYLKTTAVDGDLQGRLNQNLTLMNTSLTHLNVLMSNLETVTSDKQSMKQILQNTQDTSKNLDKFSQKLNKHFLMFRLLF